MGTIDVRLSVLVPEGLSIITGEIEVDSVRPRPGIIRILGFEDYLET